MCTILVFAVFSLAFAIGVNGQTVRNEREAHGDFTAHIYREATTKAAALRSRIPMDDQHHRSEPLHRSCVRTRLIVAFRHLRSASHSYLGSLCTNGTFEVFDIRGNSSDVYASPSPLNATPCLCSMVAYNLIQGCSYCQNHRFRTWSDWIGDGCSAGDYVTSTYPYDVPTGVVVPAWARLNTTASGTWDPDEAKIYTRTAHVLLGSSMLALTGIRYAVSPPTGTPTPLPPEERKQINIGPLVGGVLGGTAATGLILWYILWRRRFWRWLTSGNSPR